MKAKIVTLIGCLIVVGCSTTLSPKASTLIDADEHMVAKCEFVRTIDGSSGWGSMLQGTGMNNSKNEIFEKAAEMGATHVVFTNVAGGYTSFATGKGYRCAR